MEYINIPGSIFSAAIEINTSIYGEVSQSFRPSARIYFYLTDKVVKLSKKQNDILNVEHAKALKLIMDAVANEFPSDAVEKMHIEVAKSLDILNTALRDSSGGSAIINAKDYMGGKGIEGIISAYAAADVYQNTLNIEGGGFCIPNVGDDNHNFIELSH